MTAAMQTLAALHLPTPVWWFYALGPQLLLCLWFGYAAARRSGGDLVYWLAAAFCAALFPVAGVLVMLGLWWRVRKDRPGSDDRLAIPCDGGKPTASGPDAPPAPTAPGT